MLKTLKMLCLLAGALWPLQPASAQITLEECWRLAEDHYPLVQRYDLIEASADFTLDNLAKGYLPRLSLTGQGTWQSDVTAWPDAMKAVLSGSGYDVKGLSRWQYRLGVDISQSLYDGGDIRTAQEVARANAAVRRRQNDVDLYALRERVSQLYFGLLLISDRLQLNGDLQTLLSDNCRKLKALYSKGLALQADVDALQAEYLGVCRQRTELQAQRDCTRRLLELFVGRQVDSCLIRPLPVDVSASDVASSRPEFRLFEAQGQGIEARRRQLSASLRPRLSLFAQGFYGYPGYNMFDDMFDRKGSLGATVGLRLQWNISSLYTYRNSLRLLQTEQSEIENARDVFIFNTNLLSTEQQAAIVRYRKMMDTDHEIIRLRTAVRKSAEAKLEHGVIDVNDLLQEITRENQARTDCSTHELEMLKSMYEWKITQNR